MKDKLEGKLHEVKGAATGDAGEEFKGKAQGALGDAKKALNDADRKADKEPE